MQFGFWSVVPPLLTIVLALVTKNVFISLILGIFTGCMILSGGAVFEGVNATFYSFIHTFESNGNTITLMSFLLIGALIYLIEKSGGIEGFTEVMIKKRALIKSKRGANLFTWLLGIIMQRPHPGACCFLSAAGWLLSSVISPPAALPKKRRSLCCSSLSP